MSANVRRRMSADRPPPRHDDEGAPAQDPAPPANPFNPYARPIQAEPERPVVPGVPEPVGPARRLAGALLIANAILVLVWAAVAPSVAPSPTLPAGTDAFQMGTGVGSVLPAIIDIAIGVSLLRGSAALVPWAIVRCVGGLVLSMVIYLTQNPLAVLQQAVLTGAIIGLLAGHAGRARTAVAGSAAGLSLVLEMVGIAAQVAGSNPLASVMMSLSGDIESTPAEHVAGRDAPYDLSLPNKSWYLRKQAAVARDNPIADRWLVRPDKDAHVIVIAEQVPDKMIPIDAYTDAIITNLKSDATNVTLHARGPWPTFGDRGRLVHAAATKNGMNIEWRYALVTMYGRAYYIVGFAGREVMPSVDAEIRAIFDSFRLPDSVQDAVPADVEPAKVTRVQGSLLPYTLEPPDDRWRLRKGDVVKAENPIIDRWLTRPELGAHVLVVAEQTEPGSVVLLPAFVDNVIEAAKKGATRFEVLDRRPWARFPADGMRVRVSLTREGVDLEYDYAFHARGQRAFQIVGFSAKVVFPTVERAIAGVLDSFQPPP